MLVLDIGKEQAQHNAVVALSLAGVALGLMPEHIAT
jgi:hypothetical protein